ncbi:MAG: AMIN domain-containing protein [Desulfobulbaceae bacterium]|nr:AMIN domain-containing protein [Desulfobulbaceae bacterium]
MTKNRAIIITPFLIIFLLIFLMSIGLTSVSAQPVMEQIVFDAPAADFDRLTVKMNGAHLPKNFVLKGDRPRIVFDFPDVVPGKNVSNSIQADGNFILRVRTGYHKGENPKTRVVLDIQPGMEIDFDQNFDKTSNTLMINVFAAGMPPEPEPAEERADVAEAPAEKPSEEELPDPVPEEIPDRDMPTGDTIAAIPPSVKPEVPAKPEPDESTVIQPLSEIGEKEAAKETSIPTLHSIEFDNTSHRGEIVSFRLNDFNPPVVFGIEEDIPRIVCFFKDTLAGEGLDELIATEGNFIQNIKVGKYRNPNNIRVVFDLVPGRNYDLQQIFFKEDNLFMVIINTTGDKVNN